MYDRLRRNRELDGLNEFCSDSDDSDPDSTPRWTRRCRGDTKYNQRHTDMWAAGRFLAISRIVDVSGGEDLLGLEDRDAGRCAMRALKRLKVIRLRGNAYGLLESARRTPATELIVHSSVYPAPDRHLPSTIPSGVEKCTINLSYSFDPARWPPCTASNLSPLLRADVPFMNVPFSLRHMAFIFTHHDTHVRPDVADLRCQVLQSPVDGDYLPLGWLRYLAFMLVRVCHRVKFTFVGLLDLDPTLLGFAEPMAREQLKDAILAALQHRLDNDFEYLQDWWPHICSIMFDSIRHATYEDRWRGIENIEFLTHDEYRARTAPDEYALETSRPGWPMPLSTNLDKPETKEDDNASCDPLVGDAA